MKNSFFVLVLLAFGFVFIACRPAQKSVKIPDQINPIKILNGIRDKADVGGYGILEYELYDVPGNESSDFLAFVRLYTGILEHGHDSVRGIYVFDHDNYSWGKDNTALVENVKTMMSKNKRNLSTTRLINPDGSARFIFNFLNSSGKYEYYTVEAHIRGDKNANSKKEDYDKAIADYTEAIRLDPESAQVYINRGSAYYLKNGYDKAIADYTEAIRLDPENAGAFSLRGLAYYFNDNYGQAIADYTEAIRLDPENAEAYINRGWPYYEKEDYDQAIADYTEAIRLDPKNAEAYSGRGLAYYEKEDYDQAIADYTEAIRLDPKSAWAYIKRADVYEKKGEYNRAIADYNAALRLYPNDTDTKKALEEAQKKLRSATK